MSLPFLTLADIYETAPWTVAMCALSSALSRDVEPEDDSPRLFSPSPEGEFLMMPGCGRRYSGVKVLTIAPDNPRRGLEKIQGTFLLFDSVTSAPLAALDGTALTAVRTPATTLLAVKHIASAPGARPLPTSPAVLVFGAGTQALNHVRAAHSIFPGATFQIIGRRKTRVESLLRELAAEGINVSSGDPSAVADADIILCTTSSTVPLFDGALPKAGSIVAAVGQHGLNAREVDATLVKRSDVVVESRAAAMREAGDLIPARSAEEWKQIRPVNLKELVMGHFQRDPAKPCLYVSTGMAWEDLVLASLVYDRSPHGDATKLQDPSLAAEGQDG